MQEETGHRRRPRYRGTHPRRFEERYKEQDPLRYAAEAAHIEAKGNTLAGSHRPICVEEILHFLQPQEGQVGLDVTLGYGGHTRQLLQRLGPSGKLYALDADPLELEKTEARLRSEGWGEELVVRQLNFSAARSLLSEVEGFDFVLADLGVSSMQLDNPGRGFSHKFDGPLDLRLNPRQGASAAQWLEKVAPEKLAEVLEEFADEPRALEIARALKKRLPARTLEAVECIRSQVRMPASELKKTLQRTFMALRIAVNEEFRSLWRLLYALPELLKPGARVAILSFHSGEDRRVKKAFAEGLQSGLYSEIAPGPMRPSPEEQRSNPRSSCAKLRWAIRSCEIPG